MAKSGKDCKTYVNSGTYASPTWTEARIIRDLNMARGRNEADASARDTDVEAYLPGQKTVEISFDVRTESEDTAWGLLRDAYEDGTTLDVAVMDGDIATNGTKGYRGPYIVTQFDDGQPLNGVQTNSVTLKPTPDPDHAPAKYDITA